MKFHPLSIYLYSAALLALTIGLGVSVTAPVRAQQQAASAAASGDQPDKAPDLLSEDELEVLVARIALYPDELVALVSSASLYPLQTIEAQRFLDQKKKDKDAKPKESWDDSIISLLNYPEIVKMMSDDLDWTQALGSALSYQQKDVLIAIQNLRDKAVATGVIKTDEKVKVETQGENVVIQAADPEKIYVPKYQPEMLYEPGYVQAPITYYDEPYPSYYYPSATYFAAAITGAAIWASVIDWDDWGVWGGRWNGGDVDIDCNKCFNDIDIDRDKFKMGDVDWKNIDRSKINFDRNQIANIDRSKFKNDFKANRGNNIANRAKDVHRDGGDRARSKPKVTVDDVRKSKVDANRQRADRDRATTTNRNVGNKAGQAAASRKNSGNSAANRQAAGNKVSNKPKNVNRKATKPKPGSQANRKSGNRSAVGNVGNKRQSYEASNRGRQSVNGGRHRRPQSMSGNRGGGRQIHRGGGGRGGGRGR